MWFKRKKDISREGFLRQHLRAQREEAKLDAEIEENYLIESGLLEPDRPTLAAHIRHTERLEAEFTSLERRRIRAALGL